MAWFVYILTSTKRGTLYTGMTNDPLKRIVKHNNGTGAKYTRGGAPWEMIYLEELPTKSAAMKREYVLKQLTRGEKLQLSVKYLAKFQSPSVQLLKR